MNIQEVRGKKLNKKAQICLNHHWTPVSKQLIATQFGQSLVFYVTFITHAHTNSSPPMCSTLIFQHCASHEPSDDESLGEEATQQ